MLYVFLYTFFFTAAHFHLGVWQLAFPLFLTATINFFLFFFQQNWSPLVFISCSCPFSVIHVNVDIEIKSKERVGICCCF